MQNSQSLSHPQFSVRNFLMFLIPSLLGVLLFMTPVAISDGFTIPVAYFAKSLLGLLGTFAPILIVGLVVMSTTIAVIAKVTKPAFITKSHFLSSLFLPTTAWLLVRIIGAFFVLMVYTSFGPALVTHESTGGFVLAELLPTLLSVFIFAGLFLPLLTNFGLLEFIGALMTKVMRPLFGLPGRSAVDCISSWLGDGSVAILMSSKQYQNGHYTEREAAIVGTTFSAVSISFCLVVIAQVGLEQHFFSFYLTVCLAGVVAAIITPRLPPLCWKKNKLIDGSTKDVSHDALPEGETAFSYGVKSAISRSAQISSLLKVLKEGLQNAAEMVFGVLPVVMAIGTTALIIAEYTPIFTILGTPFIPLLEALNVPEAQAASKTIVVGFADMFIPAVLATSIESEMTRFIVAALSVTQLIYMSEVGALLLGSKIPVKLWELVLIFLLRTLVTLPVIVGMAHLIF